MKIVYISKGNNKRANNRIQYKDDETVAGITFYLQNTYSAQFTN